MLQCPLCNRELGAVRIEEHHLVPKSKRGKETVQLHGICHRFIHSCFSEKELERYYHTIHRLLENDSVQQFVKWVSKKEPSFYASTKDSNVRKSKRKF